MLWCYLTITNITVYQRTPAKAVSEVSKCFEGSHPRSVFLQFSLAFCEFSANACVSAFADILMHTSDYSK